MSKQQRDTIDAMLRQANVFGGDDLAVQRAHFVGMMTAMPAPADVHADELTLGGVPAVRFTVEGSDQNKVILYFHGGGYLMGTAASAINLASDLARSAASGLIALDYRLAPEYPAPAAVDDAIAAYQALIDGGQRASDVIIAGESAGGGISIALLVAIARRGLPLPAAGVVFSPWVDLSLSGESSHTRADVDPVLTRESTLGAAARYAAGIPLDDPRVSPLFDDLSGLPPLLIQVGSHEIFLDDATRLATRAAAADVAVALQVTPGVPHVFQGFAPMLEEGRAALTAAGEFAQAHFGARDE